MCTLRVDLSTEGKVSRIKEKRKKKSCNGKSVVSILGKKLLNTDIRDKNFNM